jgi:serine/threonine protein kinase
MSGLPAPGAIIGGRYRIEELLGRGAMGAVLRATDVAIGREVAIKMIDPARSENVEDVLRFLAEAKAIGRIDHPNVVAIYDTGREGQSPFLVMELLRGEPLDRRIARGRLSADEALAIVIDACRGVAEAHREGIVHRDLKPANIFLSRDKGVKVVDFGVAKAWSAADLTLTATGVAVGSPRYMAPEQLASSRSADVRCDVYAMGAVLYEALAGRPPFDGDTIYAIVPQIEVGPPPIPGAPPELEAVVRRALSLRPEARQPTMRALIDELTRARSPRRPAPPPVAPRPTPRWPWVALPIAAVASLLAIAAILTIVLLARSREDHPRRAQPAVALRLRDGCAHVRFTPPVNVALANETMLTATASDATHLVIALPPDMGPERSVARREAQITLLHESGGQLGWSTQWFPDLVSGTVLVRRWDPARAIAEVELRDVVITRDDGSRCFLDGRVATP